MSLFRKTKNGLITVSFVILALLTTQLVSPVQAQTASTTDVPLQIHYDATGRIGSYWGQMFRHYADGALAYCVEAEIEFVPGDKPSVTLESYRQEVSPATKTRITLIDYYAKLLGATTNDELYATAQVMIWNALDPSFTVNSWTGMSLDTYYSWMNQINTAINNHQTKPSFHGLTYDVIVGQPLELVDTNNMLTQYAMSSIDSSVATVSQSGNTLTVTPLTGGQATIRGQKVAPQFVGTSLIFLGGATQDIGTFYVDDPVQSFVRLNIIANGTLDIAKVGPTGEPVANTTFHVSSSADMSNPTSVTTNAQGIGSLPNLAAGTYYVQEVSVPAPYLLDTTVKTAVLVAGQTTPIKFVNEVALGQVEMTKYAPNNATVEGATYNLINALGTVVEQLTTGANGKVLSGSHPLGNYTLVETSVPAPYLLDPTPIPVVLAYANQTTPLTTTQAQQTNEVAKGQFTLHKTDSEINTLSLAGAEYEIKNAASQVVGTLVTDAQGNATSPLLDLGTYTYQETKAPQGYQLDPTVHSVTLAYADMNTPLVTAHQEVTNDVVKGKVQVVKVDSNNEEIPVQGVEFGVYDLQDNLVETIVSDIDGFAYSSELRFGQYYLLELSAPQEFYLNPNKYPFSIEEHGKTVVQYIANDRVLLRLQINKQHGETLEPLAGVEFQVQNEQGEVVTFEYLNDNNEIVTQDTLVTNSQGVAYTRGFLPYGKYTLLETKSLAGFVKSHPLEFEVNRDTEFVELNVLGATTNLTISNFPTTTELRKVNVDREFVEGAELRLVKVSTEEEIATWTSGLEGFVIKGLEIGETYRLEETKAPEGYLLALPIEITIEETVEPQIFELVNELVPELQTTALFEDGQKENLPSEQMTVIDKVAYDKVVIGKTYDVVGKLLDFETQEVIANATTTFKAESTSGTVDVVFTFDGSLLRGKTLVVFEDLYENGRHVATHSELTDENQTVRIPRLNTTATTLNNEKVVDALEEVTLKDVVEYSGLTPNVEQTLKGEVIRKKTGFSIAQNEITFTPTTSSGTIELTFTFNAQELRGEEVVVFEELYKNDILIGEHKDLGDVGQTVRVRDEQIRTTATPQPRNPESLETVVIRDEVKYTDLSLKEHTLKGKLWDKETGKPFLVDGKEVTNELVFTPTEPNGSVFLDFEIPVSALKKGAVVVFEDLYDGERLVATHSDINDEGQTVKYFELAVRKVDSVNNEKVLKSAEFTLYQNGVTVQVLETDENGLAKFIVEKGEWELRETKAPLGYRLSKDVIKVTITGDEVDQIYEVTAQNTLLPEELVNTGMDNPIFLTSTGLISIFLGLALIRKRKENQ